MGVRFKRWPCVKERQELLVALHGADQRLHEVQAEAERLRQAEAEDYRRQIDELRAEVERKETESRKQRETLEAERNHWREDSLAIRRSATWRIARGILESGFVRSLAGRWIDRFAENRRRRS